jgi:hypothetical protein
LRVVRGFSYEGSKRITRDLRVGRFEVTKKRKQNGPANGTKTKQKQNNKKTMKTKTIRERERGFLWGWV